MHQFCDVFTTNFCLALSYLRVRTFLYQIFQVLPCLLQLYTRLHLSITVHFRTLKDGSLLLNIFASNICFSDRNIFQNDVDALSKIDDTFLTKSWTFTFFGISDYVQILLACGIHTYYLNIQIEFQTSDVSICNGNFFWTLRTLKTLNYDYH